VILKTEAEVIDLGEKIARMSRAGDIVTLSGPLGVGKTALARGVLAALGHQGEVPSPTFAIVQPYEMLDPPVWHVDLYRIEDPAEIAELGLDAAAEALLLVEWPERAGENAWPSALRLSLEFAEDGARRLTAQVPRGWEDRWPPR